MPGSYRCARVVETSQFQHIQALVKKSPLRCAGLNRHEVENERVLQERNSEPPGPESCAATARDPAKRRQGIGGVGDRASKRCNPDADVFVMRGRQHERER
jgi:hypothetical protein